MKFRSMALRVMNSGVIGLGVLLGASLGVLSASPAMAQTGTSMVQQIIVAPGGVPFTGRADLRLALFPSQTGGAALSSVVSVNNVQVINGICPVVVDFGTVSALNGQPLWMLVRTRTPAGSGAFATQARQPVVVAAGAQLGLQSFAGPTGPAGIAGVAGPAGPVGPVGPVGATGARGLIGPLGLQGPQGGGGPQGATGMQGEAAKKLNPLRVGAQKWFPINKFGFDDPSHPQFTTMIVYDGKFIWTAGTELGAPNQGRVVRVNPSGGLALTTLIPSVPSVTTGCLAGNTLWLVSGTMLLPFDTISRTAGSPVNTGLSITSLMFDGVRLWATSSGGGTVSRINALSGAVISTAAVVSPTGLCFDGTWVWVTEDAGGSLARVDPNFGTVSTRFTLGGSPRGPIFDGSQLWIADGSSANRRVISVNTTTGAITGSIPTSAAATTLVFDGSYIWAPAAGASPIVVIDPQTRQIVGSTQAGTLVTAGASDGVSMWFIDVLAPSLFRR